GHGLFGGRKNRHVATAATLGGEFDRAVDGGEQGVVAAEADIVARVEGGATLTHEDVAGQHALAAELLHAEALRLGVATVARRTTGFLVSHGFAPVLVLILRFVAGLVRLLGGGLLGGSLGCG